LAGRAGNFPLFLQGVEQGLKNITAFFTLEFINGHGVNLSMVIELYLILNYEGGIVKDGI
jgi:hypothetical protein